MGNARLRPKILFVCWNLLECHILTTPGMSTGRRFAIRPLRRVMGSGQQENRKEEHAGTRPALALQREDVGRTMVRLQDPGGRLLPQASSCSAIRLPGNLHPASIEQPSRLITNPVNLSQNERAQR